MLFCADKMQMLNNTLVTGNSVYENSLFLDLFHSLCFDVFDTL